MLVLYGGLTVTTAGLFQMAPRGFIPAMDRGYGFVVVQLPEGASMQRTRTVTEQVIKAIHTVEGVEHDVSFAGFSAFTGAQSSSAGTIFFTYADAEERAHNGRSNDAILNDVRAAVAPIKSAMVIAAAAPPVEGLGTGSGVKMMIQDREGRGYAALADATSAVTMAAYQDPRISFPFSPYEARTPRVRLTVDRDKAEALRVPVSEINDALQIYLGSAYVNDFNYLGRTWRVTAQADGAYRQTAEDISRIWARNLDGQMVPLSSVVRIDEAVGPARAQRFNLYPAAEIMAEPAPGRSSGTVIEALEEVAAKALPPGFSFEWTEIAYLQNGAAGAGGVFLLAALFVFLVLAAQYESLSLPFAVVLIVPMSILGALAGLFIRGLDVNILTQVALIVLVGLAAKNAILIVEFAKQLEDHEGVPPEEAAAQAARLRLRPILMTSLAFILGVTPLVFSSGAGAEQRIAIGTAVFAGMIGVTIIGLLLTPVFYVVARRISSARVRLRRRPRPVAEPAE